MKPQWSIPASVQTTEDPLLDCLVLLTEHYGTPCSSEALVAGLPMTGARLSPDLFPQASSRAGLTSRLIRKPLDNISPLLLPCVLLLKDQKACLLREFDSANNRAVIQLPENGGETELPIEELEAFMWVMRCWLKSNTAATRVSTFTNTTRKVIGSGQWFAMPAQFTGMH